MTDKVRVTLWVSERERAEMERVADINGTSLNYVGRTAIRKLLGFPLRGVLTTDKPDQTEKVRA